MLRTERHSRHHPSRNQNRMLKRVELDSHPSRHPPHLLVPNMSTLMPSSNESSCFKRNRNRQWSVEMDHLRATTLPLKVKNIHSRRPMKRATSETRRFYKSNCQTFPLPNHPIPNCSSNHSFSKMIENPFEGLFRSRTFRSRNGSQSGSRLIGGRRLRR